VASTSKANLAWNLSGLNVLGDSQQDTNPAAKHQRTQHSFRYTSAPITSYTSPSRPLSDASTLSQAHSTFAPQALSSPLALSAVPPVAPESGEWPCVACTYLNAPLSLQCEVCFVQKSVRLAHENGWMCLFCGEQGIDDNFWSCRSCGWVKITS
jgi:DNA-dependent metalloprotease WSS1